MLTDRWLIQFLIVLFFSGFSIFLQVLPMSTGGYYIDTFSIPVAEVVNYTSLFLVFYAVLQIPAGIALDQYGVQYLLPIGIFITLISCILSWIALDPLMLSIARAVGGIGCSVAYISAVFVASSLFPKRYLAICIALIQLTSTIGAITGGTLVDDAIFAFGWDFTNLLIVSFAFLLFLSSLKFICFKKVDKQLNKSMSIAQILQAFVVCLKLFKYKEINVVIFYCFATWFIIMSFAGFWMKIYLFETHHYSHMQAVLLSQIYWFSFLIGSLVLGRFANHLKRCIKMIIILGALNTIALSFFAVPWLLSYYLLCLIFVLAGISTGGIVIALSIIIYIVPTEIKGSAIALTNTFIVLGGFLGQVVFGFLVANESLYPIVALIHPANIEYYAPIVVYPIISGISLILFIFVFFNKFWKKSDQG